MAVEAKGPGLAALKANVNKLLKNQVMIGVPAEHAERSSADCSPINNAVIGYLNEYGDPERNLPARPHLVPGVRATEGKVVERLKIAAQAALIGDDGTIDRQFVAIGLMGQAAVRNEIANTLSPALSPRTLYRRKHRKVAPRQGEKPLYDTGNYLNSINYVVRVKGK